MTDRILENIRDSIGEWFYIVGDDGPREVAKLMDVDNKDDLEELRNQYDVDTIESITPVATHWSGYPPKSTTHHVDGQWCVLQNDDTLYVAPHKALAEVRMEITEKEEKYYDIGVSGNGICMSMKLEC